MVALAKSRPDDLSAPHCALPGDKLQARPDDLSAPQRILPGDKLQGEIVKAGKNVAPSRPGVSAGGSYRLTSPDELQAAMATLVCSLEMKAAVAALNLAAFDAVQVMDERQRAQLLVNIERITRLIEGVTATWKGLSDEQA